MELEEALDVVEKNEDKIKSLEREIQLLQSRRTPSIGDSSNEVRDGIHERDIGVLLDYGAMFYFFFKDSPHFIFTRPRTTFSLKT